MALVLVISLRLLFWLSWLLFYASGCPAPWAWVLLLGGYVGVPVLFVAAGLVFGLAQEVEELDGPPAPWGLFHLGLLIVQIVAWVKGWPSDLVVILFWLTAFATPVCMLDQYFLRGARR